MSLADLFSGALATLRGVAGVSVTYRRGAHSVALPEVATGNSRIEMQTGADGSYTVFDSRDFLFAAEDLILNSVVTLPRAGDTIEEVSGGETFTYRAMDLGGEPCYRYSDFARTQLRVHTKLVSRA